MSHVTATPASSRHARGVWLMLASAACFVTNVLLIRGIGHFETVNVWLISCARFGVGLVLVATAYRAEWQPQHLWRNRKLVERGLLGGLGVAGYYYTIGFLGAGRATFINNTYLVWGGLMAVFILRERFRPILAVGSVAALIGLGFLTGAFSTAATVSRYDLIAIATAVASGYIVVTIRQLHASEHSSTIFSAQCAYGLLLFGVPALLHLQHVSVLGWAFLLAASLCAGTGQLLMTRAFRDLSVAEGSLLQMIVPLGIALGEFALFGERFSGAELLGAALILVGCTVPAVRRERG